MVVDLEAAQKESQTREFWATRGKAIEAYVGLEQALCRVFSEISGTTEAVAAIIFFKITSYETRRNLIDRLQRRTYKGIYNPFWNAFLKSQKSVDDRRNRIVHWSAVNTITGADSNGYKLTIDLKPPTFISLGFTPEPESLSEDGLVEFIVECRARSHICNMFYGIVNSVTYPESWSGFDFVPWQDIFRQPFVFPLPEGHPLNMNSEEPRNPLQSFVP